MNLEQQSGQPNLAEINYKVDTLVKTQGQILDLLKGNSFNKSDRGIVGVVDELKSRVSSLERWRDRIAWMLIGGTLPMGYGIVQFFKAIFKQ